MILLSRVKSDQYVTDRLHQTVIDSRGGVTPDPYHHNIIEAETKNPFNHP